MAEEAKQLGEDKLLREYYQVFQTVNEFDKQLLTVKGWGVTLSLAALAWGFQYAHYGLFLVAALSGLAFWLNEGVMKRLQMRYYLRMREIEVLQYKHASSEDARALSSPRVDSSWSHAGGLYSGKDKDFSYPPKQIEGPQKSYRFAWVLHNPMDAPQPYGRAYTVRRRGLAAGESTPASMRV